MEKRLQLHEILVEKLGSSNVYFNPPESKKLSYPCIIYSLESAITDRADDVLYIRRKRYRIDVIDRDPDCQIPDSIAELPYCEMDRTYKTDGLCYFVFTIYF